MKITKQIKQALKETVAVARAAFQKAVEIDESLGGIWHASLEDLFIDNGYGQRVRLAVAQACKRHRKELAQGFCELSYHQSLQINP